MDDKIIFDAIRADDPKAFEHLMHRYHGALYSFAIKIVGDSHAAQDVVQDVYVNLWTRRYRIKPEPSLRSYFYISTRNTAFNHLRSAKRHEAHVDGYQLEAMSEMMMIEDEKNRLLSEVIGLLPKHTGEVIRQSCEGLSQEEIAANMGITVATVKLLKSHGIKRLKELLGVVRFLSLFSAIFVNYVDT